METERNKMDDEEASDHDHHQKWCPPSPDSLATDNEHKTWSLLMRSKPEKNSKTSSKINFPTLNTLSCMQL
jgi:hypothetical protein